MATVEEDREVSVDGRYSYWAKPIIDYWLRPQASERNLGITDALLRNVAVFKGEEIPGYATDAALVVARAVVTEIVNIAQREDLEVEDRTPYQRLLKAAAREALQGKPTAADAILGMIVNSESDVSIRAVSHLAYAMRSGFYPMYPRESLSIMGGGIAQKSISSSSAEQIAKSTDAEDHMHAGLVFLAYVVDRRLGSRD